MTKLGCKDWLIYARQTTYYTISVDRKGIIQKYQGLENAYADL